MSTNTRSYWLPSALALLLSASAAYACGGFFCRLVPIDQAGEQIIFRQDGNQVTAVVLIQYAGDADDFSWVVPVPGIPELSTGSDLVFAPLELATRPQFVLEQEGSPCAPLQFPGFGAAPVDSIDSGSEGDGVEILDTLTVGPFDIQIVSSDDPAALATWLEDNNYDLSDRGLELIAPYVDEGMNFVALRLRQDQGVGDLQPLIMKYQSDQPTIPIRLTAVAAQEDMGVLVWLLGPSRAVPLNYLHVTPNYTRLNWYAGTFSAYASYQGLITAAMNEAGGQGFATDYAGRDLATLLTQLPSAEPLENEIVRLSANQDTAQLISELSGFGVFPQSKVLEILRRHLPLPEGQNEFVYQVPALLSDIFSMAELDAARDLIISELVATVIDPLNETLTVFDGDPYMTRLYTTLSPEEMTLDPTFSFNPDLEDQPMQRNAKLHTRCDLLSGTRWTLTLGEGTGRAGQVVIDGIGDPPFFTPPVIAQDAVFRSETLRTSGQGEVVTQKEFGVFQVVNGDGTGPLFALCGSGSIFWVAGAASFLIIHIVGLRLMGTRRRQTNL